MQKIVVHRPGGLDRLVLETHPTEEPGAGAVRVRTRACGVNYADIAVRRGLYASAREYVGWPITPGFEFSGIVDAVGAGVTTARCGDAVFGIVRFGAYATHVHVPAPQLFPLPPGLSFEQAAAFPAVFMTAYHALFQAIRLRPGSVLLVHSAAGGVGSALLQLGRLAGCRVVGIVGAGHKLDAARESGADAVIDKSREDWVERAKAYAPEGYDVVLDPNGPSTLGASYELLRPTGKLIVYGFASMLPRGSGRLNYLRVAWDYARCPRFSPLSMTTRNRSVVAFNLSFLFDHAEILEEGMRDLLSWLEDGRITPPRVTMFPLADVAGAHRAIESGTTTGKLVLVTEP